MPQSSVTSRFVMRIFATVAVLFLAISLSSYSHAEEALIAFWRFDEGKGEIAKDSSGNANHGTIRGADWVEGISGKALRFDGKDDYVDCGENITRRIKDHSYTVEAWVKRTPAPGLHYIMSFINMRMSLSMFWHGTPGWNTGYQVTASDTPPANQWCQVVGVLDHDAKSMQLYINGVPQAVRWAAESGTPQISGTTYIGTMRTAKGRFFAGAIDEVRVYDRGLKKEEIQERYTGMTGKKVAAPKPAAPEKDQRFPTEQALKSRAIPYVRFGASADPHSRIGLGARLYHLKTFLDAMAEWKPNFIIDLGDFAIQMREGPTTPEMHDGQLKNLIFHVALYSKAPCPAYYVMGNHDAGWRRGGQEKITPEDLYGADHAGEDITKAEWVAHTRMSHRYYSFDVKGFHFIVLDGNNPRGKTAVAAGHDGVAGVYWIDDVQKAWLARDLAANRAKQKIVFCHEEFHYTPKTGSGEGGDVPLREPTPGKESSYVDNGWELRKLFTSDGKVVACFFGHRHRNRWTVYGGVHYITLAATHRGGSGAKITICDKLFIEGVGNQRSYILPIPR